MNGQPTSRTVAITVHAPTSGDATAWAQSISDLVTAEYGQEMRLDIRISGDTPPIARVSGDVIDGILRETNLDREGDR
jgi:hypothetical protein